MMTVTLGDIRIAYYCVPKAGKTTMKNTMKKISEGGTYVNYGDHPISPLMRRRGRDHHRITVVRDPVDRLISAWSDRVGDRDDIRRSSISTFLCKPLGLNPSPDLEEFVLNLRKYQMINDRIFRHVIPQIRYIGTEPDFFQAIYSVKDMARAQDELSELVGKDVRIEKLNVSKTNKQIKPVLSTEALEYAREYYRKDYDLYGKYF